MQPSGAVYHPGALLRELSAAAAWLCLLFLPAFASPAARGRDDPSGPVLRAARDVLTRLVHERQKAFRLGVIPKENGRDVFDLQASGGIVTVNGSDAVAITRGIYHYLKNACDAQVTWSGTRLALPNNLPSFPRVRVRSPYSYRQYMNVCTFGYTTVWWDWARWEKEIDWMALHGINMPLAMVGGEAVWESVWNSIGISDADLAGYFTGPAFLPWHRMGNLNGHGGPLPAGWIREQAALQKKILERMRSLGMKPVVPAFSGFVPATFKRLHPDASVYDLAEWGEFPENQRTHILSPSSPLFREIGRRFIAEYRRMFGPVHYYLADSFNELQVPVSEKGRYAELADFGRAVYSSITDGDPDGVWVMQGWLFYNDRGFWDKPSVKALLSGIPNDRMIILDLANELFHGWKAQEGFYGKQWIYSLVHNFGGNNPLNGDLPFVARDPAEALTSLDRGALVGMGLAPEGVENNDVIYELTTDMEWSETVIDLPRWLDRYTRSRYGGCPPAMTRAWGMLVESAYGRGATNIKHGFQARPGMIVGGNVDTSPAFREAVRLFLSCADSLGKSPLYIADATELTAQLLGKAADDRLRNALRAHDAGMQDLRDALAEEAFALMRDLDALMSTRSDRRLETWIADARRWGATSALSDYYEWNARLQVTIWGGPVLFDYASKVWGGLIRDFYLERWRRYFDLLRAAPAGTAVPADRIIAWEDAWTRRKAMPAPHPVPDPLGAAREMLGRASRSPSLTPEPVITPDGGTIEESYPLDVNMSCADPEAEIRFTLDGSVPLRNAPLFTGHLAIAGDVTLSARAFGKSASPSFVAISRYALVKKGINGLIRRSYEGTWTRLPDFDTLRAIRQDVAYRFELKDATPREDFFALQYAGFIEVLTGGTYEFTLGSDDGSRLLIDGSVVVNNDGMHAYTEMKGRVRLSAGRHPFSVEYFESAREERLEVWYEGAGMPKQPIPASRLFLAP